ncbi:MAG: 2-amino-4-hydroxy-6-hydroxymethyldihydropteridine diphosphokinase [Actinomycetota bacterium]|jgi:2-amino-4-hydroxy-6-hydroxymethyldihydropteridine diphosphokinase|nr:2-amino-4-hydroxy-6-hydroxymethyldihydropteridine diphosphokinase [Actinomycetota bacterium]
MTTAWIGIGSNVGDRAQFARRAVEELRSTEGLDVTGVSSLYETSPIGGPPQRSYVNLAVRIETELEARPLLELLQSIEQRLGRDASAIRWGPRVIDLDLLLVGDEKVSEPDLEVPHPRLSQRNFVLVPLLEIDPDLADPWGSRYEDALDEAEGDVQLLEPF